MPKGCQDNEKCIHIKECPELRILARRVKNAKEESKKIEILSKIKSRLCGAKRAFAVCCEAAADNADRSEDESDEHHDAQRR